MKTNRLPSGFIVSRRQLCFSLVALGTVGVTCAVMGRRIFQIAPEDAQHMDGILCRNPAYTLRQQGADAVLATTTGGRERAYALDAGGAAVWHALPTIEDIRKGIGKTVGQVVEEAGRSLRVTDTSSIRAGALAFLRQAAGEGLVVSTDGRYTMKSIVRTSSR
ncbi:MAG TPA: hypothetical protein PLG22_04335 [Kiritimatiellia bacterium]|nr:hypothetical protein [Kiritimatiellia bacterium]